MEYEEMKEKYDNMSYREFGEACKKSFNTEYEILQTMSKVSSDYLDLSISALVKQYNAMELYFQLANFLLRVYITADKKGIVLNWDDYDEHLHHYFKDVISGKSFHELLADFERDNREQRGLQISSCHDTAVQKKLAKFRKKFVNYGDAEKLMFICNESFFGFSKGLAATDEKMYVRSNGKLVLKYEDIVSIYLEASFNGTHCDFFTLDSISSYHGRDQDCFKNGCWYLRIMYYSLATGEPCDGRLKYYPIVNKEDFIYHWRMLDIIQYASFLKNYEKYLAIMETHK